MERINKERFHAKLALLPKRVSDSYFLRVMSFVIPGSDDGRSFMIPSRKFLTIRRQLEIDLAAAEKRQLNPEALAPPATDKGSWGRPLWKRIHARAMAFADWPGDAAVEEFFLRRRVPYLVPCGECRDGWQKIIAETLPVLAEDWREYFAWTVNVHNLVNIHLNKPILSVEEAAKIHGGSNGNA